MQRLKQVLFWVFLVLNCYALTATVNGEVKKININTATAQELVVLKGVGPRCAQKVVEYREQHGAFTLPEDIMKVSGIGPKVFEENKEMIEVGSESATLKPTQ